MSDLSAMGSGGTPPQSPLMGVLSLIGLEGIPPREIRNLQAYPLEAVEAIVQTMIRSRGRIGNKLGYLLSGCKRYMSEKGLSAQVLPVEEPTTTLLGPCSCYLDNIGIDEAANIAAR